MGIMYYLNILDTNEENIIIINTSNNNEHITNTNDILNQDIG